MISGQHRDCKNDHYLHIHVAGMCNNHTPMQLGLYELQLYTLMHMDSIIMVFTDMDRNTDILATGVGSITDHFHIVVIINIHAGSMKIIKNHRKNTKKHDFVISSIFVFFWEKPGKSCFGVIFGVRLPAFESNAWFCS